MNRRPVIAQIQPFSGRTIAISDIHGSLEGYEKLLQAVKYRPGADRLILVGDLCEKGPQSLALVRRVMKQCQSEQVLVVMGNCDFVAKNILYAYRLDFLRTVLSQRAQSLIHEMIAQAGLDLFDPESTDMDQLAASLRRLYLPELSFLNDLPHVLVTPDHIFAHAAILDEEHFADDFREIMSTPMFLKTDRVFSRPVVVGHMPVSEYCRRIASFNPRFEWSRNIIAIDGGFMVNDAGQLNALILDGHSTSTVSVDLLPKAEVLQTTHPFNPAPFYLNWNQGQVRILEARRQQYKVHSDWLNRSFWVDRSFVCSGRATDFTNYWLPLRKGSLVSVVRREKSRALVRSNGILGWCDASLLRDSEETGTETDSVSG